MCRFTLYMGPPIRLETLLIEPAHSLIRQSVNSEEREEPLNGDGFGVGWYAPDLSGEPAVFRSITGAWNNRNLHNLARVVASPTILAHVRAATQASGVNEANCHPFRFSKYLCMHNGDIAGFRKLRRRLLESVCDDAFSNVYGSTDSEHFFAVVIDELSRAREQHPLRRMAGALNRAIWRVVELAAEVTDEASCLNVALCDGERAVLSRFCSDPNEKPETLYTFTGSLYTASAQRTPRRRRGEQGASLIVSSERLTDDPGWAPVPANHIVAFERGSAPRLFACEPRGLRRAA